MSPANPQTVFDPDSDDAPVEHEGGVGTSILTGFGKPTTSPRRPAGQDWYGLDEPAPSPRPLRLVQRFRRQWQPPHGYQIKVHSGVVAMSTETLHETVTRQIQAVLREFEPDGLRGLLDSVRQETSPVVEGAEADGYWGPAPTPKELHRAEVSGLLRMSERRARVARRSRPLPTTSRVLGIAATELRRLAKERSVLVIDHEGRELVPTWQLSDDFQLLPGLGRLIEEFPGDAIALSLWAERGHPDLDYQTPAEVLANGESDRVLAAAQSIGFGAW